MGIHELFYPRGVAVIGSAVEGKIGYELIKQLVDGGFPATYAVNPKAQGALGAPGYPTLAAIDQPVDLAVIISPAATVPGVLEDCGRAGVRAAAIITAGFAEAGNPAAEDEIRQLARRHDVRFVGPNCAGLLNTGHHLYPTLETRPPAGVVSFVSQSGALGGAVLAWAEEQGLGFAKFVSYGNGADLTEVDFLDYLREDDETRVVALYVETVSDGRAFMRAARELAAVKPLVVIKSGRTRAGQRATLSHTGSLAGADEVYAAALRECGAIRVHGVEELFDLCRGFVSLPPLRGRRVAIVTNSGGPGVLTADRADELGLDVREPSPQLREKLEQFLPSYCSFKNPIDMTVEGNEDGYRRAVLAVLDEYDAALALDVCTPYLDSLPHARGVCDAAAASDKPVLANFMAGKTVAAALPYLKQCGVPNYVTGERAMTVLAGMAEYQASRQARRPLPELVVEPKSLPGNGRMLEPEAMAWLRENGLPAPEWRLATDEGEAQRASREIGYPVVMKVVSPDILHKSDSGGVVLAIQDEGAARLAFRAIRQAAAGHHFRGVLVYPMIRGGLEVIMGISQDPQFGPVVVFGLGGIYTEALRDVSLRVAPVDRVTAAAMIREIRAFPILRGMRGQPPRDLDALADMLAQFSQLPFRYPEIAEVDLNPVFALPRGAVVGDVRVIRKEQKEV